MTKHALLALCLLAACGGHPAPAQPTPAPSTAVTPTTLAAPPAPPAPVGHAEPPPLPGDGKPAIPEDQLFAGACHGEVLAAKAQIDVVLAAPVPRTVANTLEPYNELLRHLGAALDRAGLMEEVHPDAKVRDAARACEREAQELNSTLFLDKRLYDAFVAVDLKAADAETRRFVLLTLQDFRRAGVTLADAARTRIQAIDAEVTTLSQEHSKNIAEDTRSITVTDPRRLGGLPADWVAAHKPDAQGAITITTDYPDSIPFMTYADDDALRKELFVKFDSRGDAHNEQVLQRLLTLRAEKAKLLGFKDWADFQSDDKMLKGGKAAAAFIARVTALSKRRAAKDYAELLAQLKKHDPKATTVGAWQKFWLATEVKRDAYAVDAAVVRTYFTYDSSLKGLLDLTSAIYDIQYQPVTDAQVWHPAVQVFDVTRGAEKLGRIYLDMHPRADKFKHAAQFPLVDGITGVQLPEGALVCNLPDPATAAGPALMDHGEVVTMFHEFGHLMHQILGGHHHWVRLSGVATEQDFVEAPSQMFEEWAWRYETLSRFARNAAGEVIPKDLVAKMRKADKFGLGLKTAQQMFYAAVALRFHQADPAKLDQLATVKALQHQYTPFAYVEGTKFHASFGHLVGYSSMYYTYMWSLVIAKDLLTGFAKGGLLDPAATHAYRDKILAPGGSKDAAALVKDFLGRASDFKAFERYLAES
jgi:thimet oligopeptidase